MGGGGDALRNAIAQLLADAYGPVGQVQPDNPKDAPFYAMADAVLARDAECQAAILALPATFPGEFDFQFSVYRSDVLAILRGTTDA